MLTTRQSTNITHRRFLKFLRTTDYSSDPDLPHLAHDYIVTTILGTTHEWRP